MAADNEKTFSETWYRVAGHAVYLRPRLRVQRQVFRGERWYVLEDRFNNQFFRLRTEAYAFVAKLGPDRTVDQVWRESISTHPNGTPGQEEVIQLLAQLHQANLLHHPSPADAEQLFARYRKRRQKERWFTVSNLMFARLPLFDPDRLLNQLRPFFAWVFKPWAAVAWVVLIAFGLKSLLENVGELGAQAGTLLAPGNLPLLYLGLVFLKAWHELGHAAVCKHFGGEVHTVGVMLLLFSPLPYVDVTASWAFREKRKRIAVGLAGMAFELVFAALAALVWAGTGPGVVHDLAFNMMIAAGVTTLVFNANPLLRYDGYYILSDAAGLPNLYQRGQELVTYWVLRHAFGVRNAKPPSYRTRDERVWLGLYGALSLAYRTAVLVGLIWFVSGEFLLLGTIAAVFCVVMWFLVPLGKFIGFLTSSPQLERSRPRAVWVTAGAALVLILAFGVLPVPQTLRAVGVVRPVSQTEMVAGVEGRVREIPVQSGVRVAVGDVLLRLDNVELDQQIRAARAQRDELTALWRDSLRVGTGDRGALEVGLSAVEDRLRSLEERRAQLELRAPKAGIWVCPLRDQMIGAWMPRGAVAGEIIDPQGAFEFAAVVPQVQASRLFSNEIGQSEVRLAGRAHAPLAVEHLVFVPGEQNLLPSMALADIAGGEIPLSREAKGQPLAAETFYEARAALAARPHGDLLSGTTGRLCLRLPAEPLATQWLRQLRVVFQKRATQ